MEKNGKTIHPTNNNFLEKGQMWIENFDWTNNNHLELKQK